MSNPDAEMLFMPNDALFPVAVVTTRNPPSVMTTGAIKEDVEFDPPETVINDCDPPLSMTSVPEPTPTIESPPTDEDALITPVVCDVVSVSVWLAAVIPTVAVALTPFATTPPVQFPVPLHVPLTPVAQVPLSA